MITTPIRGATYQFDSIILPSRLPLPARFTQALPSQCQIRVLNTALSLPARFFRVTVGLRSICMMARVSIQLRRLWR